MGWVVGEQSAIIKPPPNYMAEIKGIEGRMDDWAAKISLIKFLRQNLGFTFELISGMRLLLQQEIILKALFARDNGLIVAGRGLGKSTIIAMFCCLYPIFYPNSKICLISANFRGSRRIFEAAEKMTLGPKAHLLKECFPTDPRKLNDILSWKLDNGAEVFALPLSNGEGLRGTRASVVFVDEGLLISEEIQNNVIRPFLTAKQNYLEEAEIKEAEDELIKSGAITEKDRISFQRNKFLVCSSASYDFDYLYKIYTNYINNIVDPTITRNEDTPTYVVIRSSYESLPEDSFIDKSAIDSAKANDGENSDWFKREYRALFSSGSDCYFSMKKMKEATVLDGENPTVQIVGNKNSQYILAIDPSYSASKSSDFFAMGVYLLIPEERRIVLVHSYGRAGMTLNDHYAYLTFILKNFNIVWISIDSSGTEFIDSYNLSTIASQSGINLGYLSTELHKDDEYLKRIGELKKEYNLTMRKIVYPQPFSGDTIRRMNEYLQGGINANKVWWASRLEANESEFSRAATNAPTETLKNQYGKPMTFGEVVSEQDDWIYETKKQLTLIEVKSTANGTMQFDLPSHIRKSTSATKPRRDNYTCMLLGYMASKYYFDYLFTDIQVPSSSFTPMLI